MKINFRGLMLGALVSVPFALTGCSPECVDSFDCAAQSQKAKAEFTCVANKCVPGSAFPDAGTGGTGGGSAMGGGTATGGGNGGGGGGTVEDAGVDAGTDDAGMTTDDAGVDAGTDDAGTTVDAGIPQLEIAQARTNAQQTLTTPVSISSATVTYLKPALGSDPVGFTVQASATGPAIFIAVDPTTLTPAPAVGDSVSFTATTFALLGGLSEVTAVTNWTRLSSGGSVSSLTQDLSAVANIASDGGVDQYESELITIRGVLDGGFTSAGTGAQAAFMGTAADPVDAVRFRAPLAVVDARNLERGCDITVGPTPMWRNNAQAQPSAWLASEVLVNSCPAPTVVSAVATSATTVLVTFSHNVQASSVLGDGSQFGVNGGLNVTAAVVTGKTVTLTTGTQTGAQSYTVSVANTVADTNNTALGTPSTATFLGFEVPAVLRINEINANIASGCDLIELRVVSGGSMNGFRLQERETGTLVLFTAFQVAKNDLIVVHMNSAAAGCNPQNATQETTSITQQALTNNYATAWDWWSTDTGLTATDNVITLYDPAGAIADAVLVANLATGTAAAGSKTQATAVATANQWQQVGGGIPATGFDDTGFRPNAALDLDATGTNSAGESIRRIDDTDDNDKADWGQGPSTWGLINAGQTPFP
jgi:hypothetical protein